MIGIITSCKKYEEGPFITFRSVKNRLIGMWSLVKYTNNGVDSTNIKLKNPSFFYLMYFTDKYDAVSCLDGYDNGVNNFYDWTESLKHNKNKYFQFQYSSNGCATSNRKGMISFPPFDSTSKTIESKWKILKLTKKEMKIQFIDSKDNETNIIIEYEKI